MGRVIRAKMRGGLNSTGIPNWWGVERKRPTQARKTPKDPHQHKTYGEYRRGVGKEGIRGARRKSKKINEVRRKWLVSSTNFERENSDSIQKERIKGRGWGD